jgi:Lipocalin-like domain
MGRILPGLFLAALLAAPAGGALAGDKEQIVGTWKLVSVLYEDAQTKERWPVLGEHPKGRQIATADGRWLALVTADGRKAPQNDAERAQALRTMIAYTGRYRVENGKVVTKVEAAWNEAWVGTEQVRAIRFDGDKLYIESPPQQHPNLNGRMVRIIVVWERET